MAALVVGVVRRPSTPSAIATSTDPRESGATSSTEDPTTILPPESSASVADASEAINIGNGVAVALPPGAEIVRHVERAVPRHRADYDVTLREADGRELRVEVYDAAPGHAAQPSDRTIAKDVKLGVRGVVEGSVSVEELAVIRDSARYDAALDRRTVSHGSFFAPRGHACPDPVVHGGGPDLVLATCDGTLAIYDGATGDQREVIRQFEDPRTPYDEGDGPVRVFDVDISTDGQFVWFATAACCNGEVYRYRVGSGVEPDHIGSDLGFSVTASPDGASVAIGGFNGLGVYRPDGTLIDDFYDAGVADRSVWSSDGSRIGFDTGAGVVGVVTLATGDIELYGPALDQPEGTAYYNPMFDSEGRLHVLSTCCSAALGDEVMDLVAGEPGNSSPQSIPSKEHDSQPLQRLRGLPEIALRGMSLGPETSPWAIGVLEAAVFPLPLTPPTPTTAGPEL